MIWRASVAQACATSALNSSGSGSTPEAPEAMSSTVSLVDMQPSTSMRLNEVSTPTANAACICPAVTTASVVMTHSMVASWGAIMPEPLTMPPMR